MASINWPSTIPQCFDAGSLNVNRQDGSIETDMDAGLPKKRRRFTAIYKDFQGTMLMTFDELDDFNTFYETTTGMGAEIFNFPDPYDSLSTWEGRFVGTPSERDSGPDRVVVSMTIRKLP